MNMIEKVARGMCARSGFDPSEIMTNGGPRWTYYADGARAALEVLAEPTDEMVEAGNRARGGRNNVGQNTTLTWDAMIKAALEE